MLHQAILRDGPGQHGSLIPAEKTDPVHSDNLKHGRRPAHLMLQSVAEGLKKQLKIPKSLRNEMILEYDGDLQQAYISGTITNIRYDIPEVSDVKIDIYNLAGKKVKTLVSSNHQPGRYKIQWNATNESGAPVSTGMYIYKIRAKDFVSVKKLLLMK